MRSIVPYQLKKFGRVNGASKGEGEVRTFVMLSTRYSTDWRDQATQEVKAIDEKNTGNKDARTFVLLATRPSRD